MKITPKKDQQIKRFALLVILGSLIAAGGTAIARADGYLTPGEQEIGDAIQSGVCQYIQANGVTTQGMTRLMEVIYPARAIADYGDAVDVINYVVGTYCPQYWRELKAFGEGFRS